MSENEIQNESLKQFGELALDMYALFCKLDRYKDKMTEPAFKFAGAKLEWLFREEFERTFAPYIIERSREKFQDQERRETLTPRRWRPWYFLFLRIRENRAAKLVVEEIAAETEAFFTACEKKLDDILKENAPPAAQTAQNPDKSGLQVGDGAPVTLHKSPKTGKGK